MSSLLSILTVPDGTKVNIDIPLATIYGDCELPVQKITWCATIKPTVCPVIPVVDDIHSYEEIQVIHVGLTDPSMLFEVCRPIYKAIRYPCLLLVQYQEKFVLGACPYKCGERDREENILNTLMFSHWLYPKQLSEKGKGFLQHVNGLLRETKNLKEMYMGIYHQIQFFALGGLTKNHVSKLVYDLTGKKEIRGLFFQSTPYKKHFPVDDSVKTKYDATKRTKSYWYRFDTEDLWYALMSYEPTRKVILGRKYKDIDELIRVIDQKYAERAY